MKQSFNRQYCSVNYKFQKNIYVIFNMISGITMGSYVRPIPNLIPNLRPQPLLVDMSATPAAKRLRKHPLVCGAALWLVELLCDGAGETVGPSLGREVGEELGMGVSVGPVEGAVVGLGVIVGPNDG